MRPNRRSLFSLLALIPGLGALARPAAKVYPRGHPLADIPEDFFWNLWYEDDERPGIRVKAPEVIEEPAPGNIQVSEFACELKTTYLRILPDGTSKEICTGTQGFFNEQVTAMVRSGEWDARDAIKLSAKGCERCMNVLLYEYCGDDGYPFGSKDWHKSGTECDLCK